MLNAFFCEVGPSMVGSDVTENLSDFTLLGWHKKASAWLKFG